MTWGLKWNSRDAKYRHNERNGLECDKSGVESHLDGSIGGLLVWLHVNYYRISKLRAETPDNLAGWSEVPRSQ